MEKGAYKNSRGQHISKIIETQGIEKEKSFINPSKIIKIKIKKFMIGISIIVMYLLFNLSVLSHNFTLDEFYPPHTRACITYDLPRPCSGSML